LHRRAEFARVARTKIRAKIEPHMAAVVSSESALRPPLRVGEWLVDPGRLLIRSGDIELSLEPRIMELLIYLAARAREVVSAEQLLIDMRRGRRFDAPTVKSAALSTRIRVGMCGQRSAQR
jgi:DNA-binding response OmpR family regulator